jgi:hypothetical protein
VIATNPVSRKNGERGGGAVQPERKQKRRHADQQVRLDRETKALAARAAAG